MVRTQIQLTEEQASRLKELAVAEGVSMAELVRRGVDAMLSSTAPISRAERRRRAMAVSGKYISGVLASLVSVHWIDAATHRAAVASVLAAGRRQLSLVDCSSFEVMRGLGLRHVFSFDRHFEEQGLERLP